MKDFSLTQFLERFAFKNPKKLDGNQSESLVQSIHKKPYSAHGSRGLPVAQLTSNNCTEDERFILEFLSKKRERREAFKELEGDREVDDDEFDAYLDGLGSKKKKKKKGAEHDDEELDFVGEFGEEFKESTKSAKKVRKGDDEEADGDDWDSDGDESDKYVCDNISVANEFSRFCSISVMEMMTVMMMMLIWMETKIWTATAVQFLWMEKMMMMMTRLTYSKMTMMMKKEEVLAIAMPRCPIQMNQLPTKRNRSATRISNGNLRTPTVSNT